MRKNLLICAAAAAALLSLAGGARAATITYTYEGVFQSGLDAAGIFGTAGDLTGVGFTAVFTRNHPAPGATIIADATRSLIEGDAPHVPIHGALTVNGVTRTFGASYGSLEVRRDFCAPDCTQEAFVHFAANSDVAYDAGGTIRTTEGSAMILAGFGEPGFLPSLDFRTLPSLGLGDGVSFLGRAVFFTEVFDEAADQILSEDVAFEGFMAPVSLRVSTSVAAVPEPGAWALMIVGFATAGAVLRRRGASAAVTLAT